MTARIASAALVALALTSFVTPAQAYVQTLTCSPNGGPFACAAGEMPKPVRWGDRCVVYYVNEDGTTDVPSSDGLIHPNVLGAVQAGFDAWNEVTQSDLRLQYGGRTNEDRAEYVEARGAEGNANVVMWRDEAWPYASKTAFAITSVTFDPQDGLIADADMELNGEHHQFTASDGGVIVDVQNTVTHEVGHFLGLDHTGIPEATMFGSAPEGETQKRTLHADDIQGIAAIYAPTGNAVTCGEFEEYFEKPEEGANLDRGCCNGASSTGGRSPAPLLAILALGALVLRKRRQRHEVVER